MTSRWRGFGEAPELFFVGYWVSPANFAMFKMPDNKIHFLIGDHASTKIPWYRLDKQASLKKTKESFRLSVERAKELAALDWKYARPVAGPPQPTITIPRLAQPLPIDGDLEKWRKTGIAPIVVRPTSSPADSSGLIRLAYEGQNLYFQILQFDDVVTFHQKDSAYQQDAVELAINGTFPNGFQFTVFKNVEGKERIWRHRFMQNKIPPRDLDPAHAPRVIRVLDNAEAVTEREILEGLYGVDLSQAKVIVTEFKLPMDKETWAQAESDIAELGPGKTFWIGFFLDDNDDPYTDVQGLSQWPATFGMFSPKEDGALAVCE
jgi:hypothetical protein